MPAAASTTVGFFSTARRIASSKVTRSVGAGAWATVIRGNNNCDATTTTTKTTAGLKACTTNGRANSEVVWAFRAAVAAVVRACTPAHAEVVRAFRPAVAEVVRAFRPTRERAPRASAIRTFRSDALDHHIQHRDEQQIEECGREHAAGHG